MQQSINPATGALVAEFPLHDAGEVDAALTAAAEAQREWRHTPLSQRLALLSALARALRTGKESHARLITEEMGKPIVEARAEIEKCALTCEHYATAAPACLADERVPSNATESAVVFDPLGVVLAIMPWNYPFWQVFRCLAPALAAGNGVILKHAANVPRCALAIERLVEQAGCPEGLFRSLRVEPGSVAGLIADDRIAAVAFTGSTEVGQIVAAQAGQALKKQVLELGGSDPFIVLPGADIATVAAAAVKARFVNAGQSCVNAKRFIVHRDVIGPFTEAFREGIAALTLGAPLDEATRIGPMARRNLRTELHDQVQRSVAQGASLRLGGHVIDGPGFWYAPTLLTGVTPAHAAFREEVFGPVAPVIACDSADHAVALANDTDFGLGASVWTDDPDLARRMARRIDAGAVFINGVVASDPRLPFGGVRKSGYGRELGRYGIREFCNIKTLWIGPET